MPTENERKYVLGDPEAVLALWDRSDWSEIRQGYLPGDVRIRRQTRGDGVDDSLTCKIAVPGRLVEIETALDARDFDDLWPLTDRRIHKRRRTTVDGHGLRWDVDLFLDAAGAVYWAMAECEMPEGQDAPVEVLPPLAAHIRYLVPRSRQAEFSSARLANPVYAASLGF